MPSGEGVRLVCLVVIGRPPGLPSGEGVRLVCLVVIGRPPGLPSGEGVRLVCLVVRASAWRAAYSVWNPGVSGSSHASDFKTDIPVATLPGAWRCSVSTGQVGPVSVYCDRVRKQV